MAVFLREGPFVDEVRRLDLPVRVESIPRLLAPASFVRAVLNISRWAQEERVEAIVDCLGYTHLYGSLAARLAGAHSIWWDHALPTTAQWLDRLAGTFPTDLAITSSNLAQDAHRRIHRATRCCVVHPGVDLEHWAAGQQARSNGARQKLQIDQEAMVITTLGRIEYGKGQDILVEAARIIVTEFPHTRFLLVGGSGGREEYAVHLGELIRKHELTAHVRLLGHRRDIPALLGLTDVYVHPARYPESFGLSIVEAMACGKPIVATRVGGPEEILQDGSGGILVPAGNPEALAAAMRELIQDRTLRESMGRHAMRLARSYNVEQMLDSFYEVVEEVSGNRS